jgi:hypothetical protein
MIAMNALGSEEAAAFADKEQAMQTIGDGLWDPASGRFHTPRLRREMLVRLWTADDLAHESGVSRTTVYKALAGAGVLHMTAYKIILAIERCQPVLSDIA